MQVSVRDNNVDQALKALKKKMQREGIFREMKLRRAYEKPSERKAREKAEAVRRARKLERKRIEREGFSPFWAVIDHTALIDIEREAKLFTNAPEPVLTNDFVIANRPMQIKTLIHTDAPLHTNLRKLTSD